MSRRRDLPRRGYPAAAREEQCGARREGRRRQDRDRGRSGATHCVRRGAARPQGRAHHRPRSRLDAGGHIVPGAVRRPDPSSRAGAPSRPQSHPVRRRVAQPHRTGHGDGRGDGRRQHAEARARPRRHSRDRCDDGRGIQQVDQDRSRARAPLSAGHHRGAGCDPDVGGAGGPPAAARAPSRRRDFG